MFFLWSCGFGFNFCSTSQPSCLRQVVLHPVNFLLILKEPPSHESTTCWQLDDRYVTINESVFQKDLWKSGDKCKKFLSATYLHVLLFILRVVRQEKNPKTSTHRARIFSVLCASEKILGCTDVRRHLGNIHLELNVQHFA